MAGTDIRGVVQAPTAQLMGPVITLWILWGSTYLGIALVVQTMPPLLANGARFLAAAVIMGALLVIFKGPSVLKITRAQFKSTAIMGVMLLGVGIGNVSLAERYVPSGIAALIVAVMPLWIIIFRVRAGDRIAKLTIAGVAIGLFGLILMLLPGGTTPVSGTELDVAIWSVMIALGSLSWAFFSWRSSRYDLPKNPFTTTFYELLIAGLFLTVMGFVIGEKWDFSIVSNESMYGWTFLVGASVVAYAAYVWLLENAPMSLVSTYAYVNPVVAVFLGWLIIGEELSTDVLIGVTIVVTGVIFVVSGERSKPPVIEETI
jgi:drug/metabolite transporter (DMT)-like permease